MSKSAAKFRTAKASACPTPSFRWRRWRPKDIADLEAALDAGIDWVALSFIQRPEDIAEAKKLTRGRAAVMAKIEKPQAVARLDDILELADALMVARGDLGVEMPLEKVPGVQKEMTRACRRAGKPVVVATQMLESMIASPVPTRAEVSDVATAIFDGADAIMLSAESASGQYPVEAVATMNRIAEEVENDAMYLPSLHVLHTEPEATGADAIAAAARQVAETLDLPAIVCWTSFRLDRTAGLARAAEMPDRRAFRRSIAAGRKLSVVWGIHCVIAEDAHDQDDMVERACRLAFKEGFAKAGQRVIVVAGVPLGTPGATNFMRIAFVGAQGGRRVIVVFDSALVHQTLQRQPVRYRGLRPSRQRLHHVGDVLEVRIDRERLAIGFERVLVVADLLQHQAEAGQRAEMARLARQHLADDRRAQWPKSFFR